MFDAPSIVKQIPDIAKIYQINDGQITELEDAIDQIDSDLFADTMSDEALKHWEKIYDITVFDDESMDDRRTKVKGKFLEKLPYSYRVIVRNLDNLLPYGYDLSINENLTEVVVKINLMGKYLLVNVQKMLDDMLPLNMTLDVDLKYNTYAILAMCTHGQLSSYTYQGLNDEPIIVN